MLVPVSRELQKVGAIEAVEEVLRVTRGSSSCTPCHSPLQGCVWLSETAIVFPSAVELVVLDTVSKNRGSE